MKTRNGTGNVFLFGMAGTILLGAMFIYFCCALGGIRV